jgi:shikimate dehydrogenase
MKINAKTKINIIIGDPVDHSLSPEIHNAAYKELGIDDQYVFLAANVKSTDIKKTVEAMRVMGIRGLTCTMPHKLIVMKYLDEIDQAAKDMVAVNTVVNDNGKLIGYNTDWLGVIASLKKVEKNIKNKRAIVFGAGGVGRSIVYGLLKNNIHVLIVNRTVSKAKKIVRDMNLVFKNKASINYAGLDEVNNLDDFDFIFNATSVGMEKSASIINKELINSKHIVFDAVYFPLETLFIKEARAKGARVIHGSELLLNQALHQFEYYTNRKAPEAAMRKVLNKYLVKDYS